MNLRARLYFKAFAVLIFLFSTFPNANAQNNKKIKERPVKNYWSINGNFGSNLFYGDLGEKENQWAYGLSLSKKISPLFSINAQGLYGTLKGRDKTIGQYFEADFYEYNINLKVDLSTLIYGINTDRMFSFYGLVGVGMSNFNTERYTIIGDTLVGGNGHFTQSGGFDMSFGLSNNKFKTGEGILPVGLGCNFRISKSWDFTIESTIRGINPGSDNLDDIYDNSMAVEGYGYTCVGLTYKFGQTPKRVRPPKYRPEEPIIPPKDIIAQDTSSSKTVVSVPIQIIAQLPDSTSNNSEFEIKIQINKGNITGKGRIQQTLSTGFTATDTEDTNGDFEFRDQIVSLGWDELPDQPIIVSTIKIKVTDAEVKNHSISGMFFYEENNQNKIRQFKNTILVVKAAEVIAANDKIITPDTIVTPDKIVIPDKIVTDNNLTTTTATTTQGIEYRVQVRAIYGGKESPSRVASQYNLTGPVYEDFHNGYTKYSNGSFKTYSEANAHKTKLRESQVPDAFVVAFNDGKRLNSLSDIASVQSSQGTSSNKPFQPGVEYRIQVGAFSKGKVSTGFIATQYNLTDAVSEEIHKGLSKFTVGSFNNFNEAKTYLSTIRANVQGAFIVKYVDGIR